MAEITFFIAFFAGLVSFFAPCVLPLVPGFLGYLSGQKIDTGSRFEVFKHSVLFVLGFGTVFSVLGVLLNGLLLTVAFEAQVWLGRVAGVVIILFGFYLLGFIQPAVLLREHKISVQRFKSRELTSFVFGAAFAIGWSPCVGAVLGSILALAASMPGESFILLLGYSVGLGIPFLIVGLFAQPFVSWLRERHVLLQYYNYVVGVLMLILGVLVFTGKLALIVGSLGVLNEVLLK